MTGSSTAQGWNIGQTFSAHHLEPSAGASEPLIPKPVDLSPGWIQGSQSTGQQTLGLWEFREDFTHPRVVPHSSSVKDGSSAPQWGRLPPILGVIPLNPPLSLGWDWTFLFLLPPICLRLRSEVPCPSAAFPPNPCANGPHPLGLMTGTATNEMSFDLSAAGKRKVRKRR